MDKSDIAIIISLASALGAVLSAYYTRRHYLIAKDAAKRPDIVFELSDGRIANAPDGARFFNITARNLSPVAAKLDRIEVRNKKSKIIRSGGQFESIDIAYSDPIPRMVIPWGNSIDWGSQVNPLGTQRHPHGLSNGDTSTILILAKGVASISDLKFKWSWLDGHKR